MKYTLLIICCSFVLHTSYGQTNGLVAHWDFNGNVNDASGNGHNGTANNITYGNGKQGQANTAAVFNGTNSYIDVPYQADLNVSKYTICAIVKPNGYYTGACQANMILARGTQYQAGYYRLLYFDNAFDNDCNKTDTSKNVFQTDISYSAFFNAPQTWKYTPTIVSNTWYCVVATYDNDTARIYVDGVLKSTAIAYNGTIGTSNEGITIGAYKHVQYPYWLNGTVDDIKLYNRAFDSTELANYCNMEDTDPVDTTNNPTDTTKTDSTTTVARVQLTTRSVTIYPTPAHNQLNIHTDIVLSAADIRIYNQIGKVVITAEYVGRDAQIDISALPAGVYIFTISSDDGQMIRKKFIKQ